jgi:L-cysteine S-thiosulfotransferase
MYFTKIMRSWKGALTAVALLIMAFTASCATPANLVGRNFANVTANPETRVAILGTATPTQPFVAAWVIFGTPTPGPTTTGEAVAALPTATQPSGPTPFPTKAPANTVTGNPANGKQIFTSSGTCFSCHDVSTGNTLVGPSLKGIASRAGSREPNVSAHDYLYESITNPNKYVVKNFQPNIMPAMFKQMLSAQQINDLVAYLLTLK